MVHGEKPQEPLTEYSHQHITSHRLRAALLSWYGATCKLLVWISVGLEYSEVISIMISVLLHGGKYMYGTALRFTALI